ncbi:MAG TPA: dihydrolipoamide acetyltransferase family protein [Thermodesulfobacteriota bacterium]|nr:dihydrolipoamide acetyltransferase family protein [Thermodesulfobacteriota bacterium]
MAVEIVMPKLSDTMEEGKILRWLKKEGDFVNKGDVVAEVETDKADMDLEVFSSGILTKIIYKDGDTVPVGTVIAVLGGEKTVEVPKKVIEPLPEIKATEISQLPEPKRATGANEPCCTLPLEDEEKEEEEKEQEKKEVPLASRKGDKVKISPRARRLLEEKGITIPEIKGTGPGGRIVQEDIEKFLEERSGQTIATISPLSKKVPEEISKEKVIALSRMRAAIARRMMLSKQTIPHFYVTQEIEMSEAANFLDSLNKNERLNTKITYNDLVIKACALALKDFSEINAHFNDKGLIVKNEINIGFVVALPVGLIVPVIKNADALTIREISTTAKGLRDRVLKRNSTSDDLSGGTFSISNMGMFGVEEFSAIINPPQVAILAVSAVKDKPIIKGGVIQPAKIMKVTLSADHRALDGVMVAKFLKRLKEVLENLKGLE